MRKSILFIIFLQFFLAVPVLAKGLFSGEINEDKVNVRVDSTIASEVICRLNRTDVVEVVRESYDWYKIRLPKQVPSFVREDLVLKTNDKSGKVLKENVNVRLHPSEGAPIIGKADKDEAVDIAGEKSGWLQISAVERSFGWIHKKFVNKITAAVPPSPTQKIVKAPATSPEPEKIVISTAQDGMIVVEGIVEPRGKIFKRKSSHKLVAPGNKMFFLKGNIANLNAVCYHKVRVTGTLIPSGQETSPEIEITKLEILD